MNHACFLFSSLPAGQVRPGAGRWGGPLGPLGVKPRGGWWWWLCSRGPLGREMSSGVYVSHSENVSS